MHPALAEVIASEHARRMDAYARTYHLRHADRVRRQRRVRAIRLVGARILLGLAARLDPGVRTRRGLRPAADR